MNSPDGKALLTPLETTPEAILQEVLANYDSVQQRWSQFGENRAGIIQAQKTAADADKAVAQLETDVTAKFKEQEAAIQQKFTAYADASSPNAIYTLKTGIKYNGINYDAGLAVAASVNNGKVVTRVAINANQFVIASGSGNDVYSPFAIVDGQAFIDKGFIGKAWIGRANITDTLQSDNYIAGLTGLSINFKTGVIEMNGNVSGQGRLVQTNNRIVVYDENGRPAAVMGQRL